MQRFIRRIVDGDESVVGTGRNEGKLRAVWRPLGIFAFTAHDNLKRLVGRVESCHPYLVVFNVGDGSRSGNRRRITGIEFFWLATGPCDGPHGLLETGGVAGGIRGLASGVFPFAPHEYQRAAV